MPDSATIREESWNRSNSCSAMCPSKRQRNTWAANNDFAKPSTIDLHGHHPAEIVFNGTLAKILQQAWEMGEDKLILIHGHGRNRGISPGFVNTNTGYFGLCGSTSIKLKANPAPTRKKFDCL